MIPSSFWGSLDGVGFQAARMFLSLLWQSSILLAAAGMLAWFLRKRSAAVRHRLWLVALLAVPLLPLLGWAAAGIGTPRAPLAVVPAYAPPEDLFPALPDLAPSSGINRDMLPAGAPGAAPKAELPQRSAVNYPWAMGFLLYGAGAAFLLLLVGLGRRRIGRWILDGRVVTDARALEAFRAAARDLGLSRRFILVENREVGASLALGILHPVVLVPAGFLGELSDVELRAVAVHELAHIRRHDPAALTLVSLLRAALFFHPLVWLGARQVSTLAEQAADDAVLAATGEPISYAKMLARLAEGLPSRALSTELAAGILFSRSAFLRRVEAILSDRREQLRKLSRIALATTVLSLLISLAVAIAVPLGEKGKDKAGEAQSKQTDGFKASIPGGGTIELLGVCYHPSKEQPWWKGDGTALSSGFVTSGAKVYADAGSQGREFVLLATDLPTGSSTLTYKLEPSGSWANGDAKRHDGKPMAGLEMLAATTPKSAASVTIQVGVATGKWEEAGGSGPGGDGVSSGRTGTPVLFTKGHEQGGKATVTVSYGSKDLNARLIAIDLQDREHVGSTSGHNSGGVAQMTASFDLPLAQVKSFQLQTRPYHWIEFRNVALAPKAGQAAEAATPPAPDRYAATFPGGGMVEVVAVSNNPSKGQPWWRPDGSLLDNPPIIAPGGSSKSDNRASYEIVYHASGFPKEGDPHWITAGGISNAGDNKLPDGRIDPNLIWTIALFPKDAKKSNVQFGVSTGKWETVGEGGTGGMAGGERNVGEKAFSVAFSGGYEVAGKANVTVTHTNYDRETEVRVVAVDKAGVEHPGRGGTIRQTQFTQRTLPFDLPLAEVRCFRLQTRPIQWVEFHDVALAPKAGPTATPPAPLRPCAVDLLPSEDYLKGPWRWKITPSGPVQIMHGWYTVVDGRVTGHFATGHTWPPHAAPIELGWSTAVEGNMLLVTREEARNDATVKGNDKIVGKVEIPPDTVFRTDCFPWPEMLGMEARTLWRGDWVRDGKIVKSVIFAAHLAAPDDKDAMFRPPESGWDEPVIQPQDLTAANKAFWECMQRDASYSSVVGFHPQKDAIAEWNRFLERTDLTKEMRVFAYWRIGSLYGYNMDPTVGEKHDFERSGAAMLAALAVDPQLISSETLNACTIYASGVESTIERARRSAEQYRYVMSIDPAWIDESAERVDGNGMLIPAPIQPWATRKSPAEKRQLLSKCVQNTQRTLERGMVELAMSGDKVGEPTREYLLKTLADIASPELRKGLENSAPSAPSASASTPLTAAFGPVIERTVNHSGDNCLIDLDTGKLFSGDIPEAVRTQGTKAVTEWVAEQGIDAGGGMQPEIMGLIGFDLIAFPAPNEDWDRKTPQSLLADRENAFTASKPGNPIYLSAKGAVPATWTFQTREGAVGLLQILGFTDNPKGVKIRYKLIPGPDATADIVPITTQDSQQKGTYVWRVTPHSPLRIVHGWYTEADGEIKETVGGPPAREPSATPVALQSGFQRAGEVLKVTVARSETSPKGSVLTNTLGGGTAIPEGTSFRTSFLREPAQLTRKHLTLWRGDFVREGKIVKSIIYVAYVVTIVDETNDTDFRAPSVSGQLPAKPATLPAPVTPTPLTAAFGPVTERVVGLQQERGDCYLDFDTGKGFSAPANLNEDQSVLDGTSPWIAKNGIDISAGASKGLAPSTELHPVLVAFNFGVTKVSGWDVGETEIKERVKLLNPINRIAIGEASPATYLFKTREGGMGVFQVLGRTENPKGVKIRYKMVQTAQSPGVVKAAETMRGIFNALKNADREKLTDLMGEDSLPGILMNFTDALNLAEVRVGGVYANEQIAFGVTAPIAAKEGQRRKVVGIVLVNKNGKWCCRDIEMGETAEYADVAVRAFRERYPDAVEITR